MWWLRAASWVIASAVVAGCWIVPSELSAASGKTVRVISVDAINDRTRDLVIDSPSIGRVGVRLLLPVGFEAAPNRRWPVLYLLHGRNDPDTYRSWTRSTDVATLTAGLPLLVVMPDGGLEGYYSNWFNHGQGGLPSWETFHLVELLTVLERDWRASDHRAVAGLSMGGLGAMLYAARSPHLFRAAASFSGILDTSGWQFPPDLWGDRSRQADIWRQHNPIERMADLHGISLFVSYGNGDPGPLDVAETGSSVAGQIERTLVPGNATFVHRLNELGIRAEIDAYGPGTHSWPYWQRELHRALPGIMRALQP
ncbi:MAG TPA: alpha/beta hydrolase family protein [Pseudonocardiaceae bacterium]|nr:alpha/beta hydrolase family protein [Pseudonocardiaceae bacterium]